jgi:hypothetical protein
MFVELQMPSDGRALRDAGQDFSGDYLGHAAGPYRKKEVKTMWDAIKAAIQGNGPTLRFIAIIVVPAIAVLLISLGYRGEHVMLW